MESVPLCQSADWLKPLALAWQVWESMGVVHTTEPMTSWNPYNPCSVGDLQLPAQFQPVWHLLHCDTKAGHPTRAWLHLPADLVLSVNCKTDYSCEVEIWRFGTVTLTRPATQEEIDAYWESDWA